jgi:hypothetical protein
MFLKAVRAVVVSLLSFPGHGRIASSSSTAEQFKSFLCKLRNLRTSNFTDGHGSTVSGARYVEGFNFSQDSIRSTSRTVRSRYREIIYINRKSIIGWDAIHETYAIKAISSIVYRVTERGTRNAVSGRVISHLGYAQSTQLEEDWIELDGK